MIDLEAKSQAVARILEGRVSNEGALAISIKGTVLGFPAMLQAIRPNWPFGVMYILETEVVEDPNPTMKKDALNLTIYPRLAHGLLGFLSHVLLFESKGMPIRDKSLESKFVFSYNNQALAERFVKYPGMLDRLMALQQYAKFSELTIKTDAGLSLSQPKSFATLDLDVCRETFRLLGEAGQVIFEAF